MALVEILPSRTLNKAQVIYGAEQDVTLKLELGNGSPQEFLIGSSFQLSVKLTSQVQIGKQWDSENERWGIDSIVFLCNTGNLWALSVE